MPADAISSGVVEGPTTVTEVWPGTFELAVESGESNVPTTTIHRFDTGQLELLGKQIDNALAGR